MTTIEPVAVWVVICDDCTPSLMVPARADRHFYFVDQTEDHIHCPHNGFIMRFFG